MIGVFDSGLGGLSVLGALAETCPAADLVYAADTAHVPYGNKTPEQIRARVLAMGQALINEGCTTLVVACNTATAEAIDALRTAHPDIPVVGVEPGGAEFIPLAEATALIDDVTDWAVDRGLRQVAPWLTQGLR